MNHYRLLTKYYLYRRHSNETSNTLISLAYPPFFLSCCLLIFAGATVANAKIVYSLEGDIYVMGDDGSNKRRLTRNTLWKDKNNWRDLFPSWSPDGTQIAFTRQIQQGAQISEELFVMNADGTDVQRLTHDYIFDGFPCWSPDGKKIAFDRGDQVHIIELATRTITQVTDIERELGDMGASSPSWSPDGKKSFIRSSSVTVLLLGLPMRISI